MINASAFPIPPQQCTLSTCTLAEAEILYVPSLAGNAFFLAAFLALLLAHTGLGIWYRTWGLLVGMFSGLLLEVIGYAGRVQLHYNPFKFGPFTMQFVCLTIAPAFLTASIYLCLTRIVIIQGPGFSRLAPRTYSILFVGCDIVSLLLQAIGGAMTSNAKTLQKEDLGIHIMIAGMSFQIFSLLLFMGLWAEFALRMRAGAATRGTDGDAELEFAKLRSSFRFKAFQIAVFSSALFIVVRSVYRLVELHSGFASAFANNEPAFMVLEAPMILLATGALAAFHPGYALDGKWNSASWSFHKQTANIKA